MKTLPPLQKSGGDAINNTSAIAPMNFSQKTGAKAPPASLQRQTPLIPIENRSCSPHKTKTSSSSSSPEQIGKSKLGLYSHTEDLSISNDQQEINDLADAINSSNTQLREKLRNVESNLPKTMISINKLIKDISKQQCKMIFKITD